jgi:septal ring factor EnvC (AmiA/AmiB activator)
MLVFASPTSAQQDATALEARRAAVLGEMEEIKRQSALSSERMRALQGEISGIDKDRKSITSALIQAAKTEKKLAQEVEDIEDRLVGLSTREAQIRQSLLARRDVLAEVLGALQRMGRNPPPALLVRPADAVASVRSAILLGAVVPEMRVETEQLMADLESLSRVFATAKAERGKLAGVMIAQAEERGRLLALQDEKAKLKSLAEEETAALKIQSEELGRKAQDVESLIATLEQEIITVRREADRIRAQEEQAARENRERAEKLTPEENKLAAALPFTAQRGNVPMPAVGTIVHRWGDKDTTGHTATGDTLATQSGAIVTAPVDGKILFAGAFRSYGQLLILDAGETYHIVLAGMDQLTVAQGQVVLSGEPVGIMGESRIASTAFDGNVSAQPLLYVEFRKDKKPVDPGPWWSKGSSGRTNDDS